MMWLRWVLCGTLVTVAQSFGHTPIWWGSRSFFLTTDVAPDKASLSERTLRIAPKMTIAGQDSTPRNAIPQFTPRPDGTIALDAPRENGQEQFCIEASEHEDVVRINRCTGGPKQVWSILPVANGGKNQIQLKQNEKCLDVSFDVRRGGNLVELRDCNDKETQSWNLDGPAMLQVENSSGQIVQRFLMRHALVSFSSMALLVAVSLGAWLFRWQHKMSRVAACLDGPGLEGGVSLTKPVPADHDISPLTPSHSMAFDRVGLNDKPSALSLGTSGAFMPQSRTLLPTPHSRHASRCPPSKMFSFERFDRGCFKVLMDAQEEARSMEASTVGTDLLVLAGTKQKDITADSLKKSGITESMLSEYLRKRDGLGAAPSLKNIFARAQRDELLPFAKDTETCLTRTLANHKGEDLITWREVLIDILSDRETSAYQALEKIALGTADAVRTKLQNPRELVGAGKDGKSNNPTLAECSVDLTQMAQEGKLDPLVGRSAEVRRACKILIRRRKNNPVLLGDPGVGKTAIAEGIAQLIVQNKAPAGIAGKRVLALEIGLLVADTKYRGEFEERLRRVIEEVKQNEDIILFIDELHSLVGAGSAEGAIDAANILKPALARGQLQCIGATTIEEFRKYIEKDAALERRFQPVTIDEPSIEETTQILTVLSPRYAEHHNCDYTPEALEAASKLSARYVSDRFLPDKAIDLMDEAGADVRMALGIDSNASGTTVISTTTMDKKDEKSTDAKADKGPQIKVDVENIMSVVSEWTGIPVAKLDAEQSQAMLKIEDTLHERVIGQDFAVSAIGRALRRARVGLRSAKRPVASMFFSGPTGVGKTELAKAVAETYYGDEKAMARFDMSEYMEAQSVSRLTGPPPGYVGYEEGGQLTEAVRRSPHRLLLFDEVEKAHPDVFNALLQILDDGRLTDNKGRVVNFTETMIILTSNVGSRMILEKAQGMVVESGSKEEQYLSMQAVVKDELGKRFRPEFLNRLDEIIVFESLDEENINSIAKLMLQELILRCEEIDIDLSYTRDLVDALGETGFSATYGARPLRRAMQRMCEDAVTEAVLDEFVKAGEDLKLDYDKKDGSVIMKNQRGKKRKHIPTATQGIEKDTPMNTSKGWGDFGGKTIDVPSPDDLKVSPMT